MSALTALEKPTLRTVPFVPERIPFPSRRAGPGKSARKLHAGISLSRKILSSLDSYAL